MEAYWSLETCDAPAKPAKESGGHPPGTHDLLPIASEASCIPAFICLQLVVGNPTGHASRPILLVVPVNWSNRLLHHHLFSLDPPIDLSRWPQLWVSPQDPLGSIHSDLRIGVLSCGKARASSPALAPSFRSARMILVQRPSEASPGDLRGFTQQRNFSYEGGRGFRLSSLNAESTAW
jgi:hypothetical protein